ncbi:hypothetical protein BV898_14011 [Hypsibius exemplaris]|uniref:Ig-like domain-containing protein n=1 Tax=Hypsibius exemplaris TaxID=2072580 RepID=A0A1W0W8Z0_HYPEX|nr:hypothetical protein BV898_14011 [Hypsibius exemplaris]
MKPEPTDVTVRNGSRTETHCDLKIEDIRKACACNASLSDWDYHWKMYPRAERQSANVSVIPVNPSRSRNRKEAARDLVGRKSVRVWLRFPKATFHKSDGFYVLEMIPRKTSEFLELPVYRSQPININVTYRPGTAVITSIGPVAPWLIGVKVTLKCAIDSATSLGNPAPIFKWTRTGSSTILAQSATLLLENVTLDDNGIYVCTPYNSVGFGHSCGALLSFLDPSNLTPSSAGLETDKADNIAVFEVNTDVSLTCSAIALAGQHPSGQGNFRWTKVGDSVFQQNGATMTILQVQLTDSGMYVCTSQRGTTTSTANFVVNILPTLAGLPAASTDRVRKINGFLMIEVDNQSPFV